MSVPSPSEERTVVTAINALVDGIAVRAIIYEIDAAHFTYEVRIDGYETADLPRVFPTAWGATMAAKEALGRWILEVLERI
jgi:hypothetical protein